jgi:hypothetical protein
VFLGAGNDFLNPEGMGVLFSVRLGSGHLFFILVLGM